MRAPTRLLAAALLAAAPAAAQPLLPGTPDTAVRDTRRFAFDARGPYRPDVPRPEALLGYPLGARNTQYGEQERVLLAVAAAARDRVRVEEIGASHEGRRMRVFIVSAPENVARLDAIRADLDRLADPRTAGPGEAADIARRTPAVVWINESVHGDESPGFESGMQLLYQLAASTEPATLDALRHAVVVINPSSNPDGHERFAVWYNSVARGDPANDAYEHREPWSIQGRFNHYRFDMNRDVIASTQPEVQAIMRGMLRWHPQVAVDQHGQVPTYFFPPAAAPVNANIGAESEKWLAIIGRANAAAFDHYGWQYFVRNEFDLYYPGYWDTWPSLNGATGMTYETDGGGWKGTLWRREDGSLLSFRDGIAKHWTAAMATIEATAARAAERLTDYAAFRRRAVEQGRSGRMRYVVLVPGADPERAGDLAAALRRAGVEVRRAATAYTARRAHAYGAGSVPEAPNAAGAERRVEAGAYVVDLAQPQGRLARAVLEPAPTLDTAFARRQIDRFRRNLRRAGGAGAEEPEFYDITAWSLPAAFGVEAYWTEDAPATGVTTTGEDAPGAGPAVAEHVPGRDAERDPVRRAARRARRPRRPRGRRRRRGIPRRRSDRRRRVGHRVPLRPRAQRRRAAGLRPARRGLPRRRRHRHDRGRRAALAARDLRRPRLAQRRVVGRDPRPPRARPRRPRRPYRHGLHRARPVRHRLLRRHRAQAPARRRRRRRGRLADRLRRPLVDDGPALADRLRAPQLGRALGRRPRALRRGRHPRRLARCDRPRVGRRGRRAPPRLGPRGWHARHHGRRD